MLGWVLRPGQQAYTQNVPVRINEAGLRDDEPLGAAKPSGELRLLVLGDSVTFGNGVATPDTYPEVLERLLRERGLAVRALNAGVQGYSVHQEADFLRERGLGLEPDALLVGFYENDVTIRTPIGSETARAMIGAGGHLLPRPLVYGLKRLRSLVFVSYLLREARWRWFPPEADYHSRDLFQDQPSPASERSWRDVRDSLAAIAAAARGRGIEPVLAVFPHPSQLEPSLLERTYQGRVLAIAGEIGMTAVDLLPAFRAAAARGEVPFIAFDGHPSAAGHRAAAEALVDAVAKSLARTARGGGLQ